jgi:hypothetical protein
VHTHRASAHIGLAVLILIGAHPALAGAQSVIGQVSGGPALLHGIGIRDYAWQVGGGGELQTGRLGIGGGVEFVYFPEVTKTFAGGRGSASSPALSTAAVSVSVSGYFAEDLVGPTQPFLTGGLTYLIDRGAPIPLLHVAAGVDRWISRRTAVRFEVRGQGPRNIVGFRVGFVFR